MNKILLSSLFILLSIIANCQNETEKLNNRNAILYESFDSDNFPTGWSILDSGGANWGIAKSCNAGGEPNELQFAWTPPFNGVTRVISSPVNFTGISSATLTFKHSVDVYEGSSTIGFATSSDNGVTWNTAWSETYDTDGDYVVESLFDSPDMGKDNVQVCLYFEGNSYNINFWFFDDIAILSQNQIDIELMSIDNQKYVRYGDNAISFTVQNMGETLIESFDASYTFDDVTVTETFQCELSSMQNENFSFQTTQYFEIGIHNLNIEITSVNGGDDENMSNNVKEKEIISSMGVAQRIPMIEHFSSSTCGPCVEVNSFMHELTENNEGGFTYVKYPMDWPAMGDPYYNGDAGIRRDYYEVISVPSIFVDGVCDETVYVTQEELDARDEINSVVDVRGAFTMDGNVINIIADFMSYVDLENVSAFISVNEKATTGNASSNGETEFYHIEMKMLDNANGNVLNVKAGEYQRLEFSYDMSATKMEDANDLEVALWLQNLETGEIYNSRFAYEYAEHCYPVQDLKAAIYGDAITLDISWEAPESGNPIGYNIYVNGELIEENFTGLSFYDDAMLAGNLFEDKRVHIAEVVAVYENGMTSVACATVIDNDWISVAEMESVDVEIYPNPAKDYVRFNVQGSEFKVIKIYNCLGILIDEVEVRSCEMKIDVSNYHPGVYFVEAQSNMRNLLRKIVVE